MDLEIVEPPTPLTSVNRAEPTINEDDLLGPVDMANRVDYWKQSLSRSEFN